MISISSSCYPKSHDIGKRQFADPLEEHLSDSDIRSCSERDAIEALMSREQLAKTKALAQTWTPADDPVR